MLSCILIGHLIHTDTDTLKTEHDQSPLKDYRKHHIAAYHSEKRHTTPLKYYLVNYITMMILCQLSTVFRNTFVNLTQNDKSEH